MSKVVLFSPDGKREWVPEDKAQEVNLRNRGWSDVKPKPEQKQAKTPANKSTAAPKNK